MKSLFLPSLLAVVLSFSSCDSKKNNDEPGIFGEIAKKVGEEYSDAKQTFNEIAPSANDVKENTSKEVEKLFTFEYKVSEFDINSDSGKLEEELTALGKDMWECFDIIPSEKTIKVFCKRRPKTYLRYLPKMF